MAPHTPFPRHLTTACLWLGVTVVLIGFMPPSKQILAEQDQNKPAALPTGTWVLQSFWTNGKPDPARIKKWHDEVRQIKAHMARARFTAEGYKKIKAKLEAA
ncbi:MAG: hypothetical protein R3236_04300, partial [Phycisphaeraceae bacterium]|nr:hypothetical protein [Phycisphaeraceae bacterium]